MISISAQQLQQRCPKIIALKNAIRYTITRINNAIKDMSRSNTTYINYSLIAYFEIPGMENKDAQKIIYGKTIEELEGKGFEVTVLGSRDEVVLHISWNLSYSKSEIDKYDHLISSRRQKNKKIKKKPQREKEIYNNNDFDDYYSYKLKSQSHTQRIGIGIGSPLY